MKRLIFEGDVHITNHGLDYAQVELGEKPWTLGEWVQHELGVRPPCGSWTELGRVRITIEPLEEEE